LRAVFPGRFQPFHYGHLEVVKWILSRWDEVVILVGSASESHTLVNPFTAGERVEMIHESLKWGGIDARKYTIVPLLENLESLTWISLVREITPSFDAIIAGNPLVKEVSKTWGIRVEAPPPFRRDVWNSTNVRRKMLKGEDDWRELVPPPVVRIIEEIKGHIRIREIAQSDRS